MTTTVTVGPVVGHYRATEAMCPGSHVLIGADEVATAASSTIWRGIDERTGAPCVLKAYAAESLRHLYENERDVQAELVGCPRLARMLACDDERMVVVKEFVGGYSTLDRRLSPLSRDRVRSLMADVLELVAAAEQAGRIGDHVLGGNAMESGAQVGGSENNIHVTDRGAVAVEMCNAARGAWLPSDLAHSAIVRALMFHRPGKKVPDWMLLNSATGLADTAGYLDLQRQLLPARRLMLTRLDRELHDTIAGNATSAAAMHEALVRLATPKPLNLSSWRSRKRTA